MAKEEEVLKLRKKLEKMIDKDADHSTGLELLKALQDLKMTLDVLQKTKIGMTVNNFRKASNSDEATTLAKSLIKSWKKLLPDNSSGNKTTNNSTIDSASGEKSKDSPDSSQNGSERSTPTVDNIRQSQFPSVANTTEPVRLKCREMLTNALKGDGEMPDGCHDPEEIAAQIEDCIYGEFKNTDSKYKNRVRSRISNLKDKRNPALRENVLTKAISAERIAKMTAEEMASDDMKELRKKFTKEAIDDHQMSVSGGTVTDLLKCGRCGQRSVTYNQVQTRSADEPMTTFCFCNVCGNRWKFC